MTKERNFGLDFMRFAAIGLVLYAHGRLFLQDVYVPNIPLPDGVEFFFILSGFLIGNIIINEYERGEIQTTRGIYRFWLKRWFRTLPNFLFYLAVIYVASKYVHNYPKSFPFEYLVFSQSLLYPHPGFFPEAWSLAVEEWFYLLFPLFLITTYYIFRNTTDKKYIMLIAIFLLITISLITRIYFTVKMGICDLENWDKYFRKITLLRLDSIAVGILGAYLFNYHHTTWKQKRYIYFGIGITLMLSQIFIRRSITNNEFGIYMQAAFYPILATSIFLQLPFFYYLKCNVRWLKKIIEHISILSYSMYLCNFSLVFMLMSYFKTESISSWIVFFTFFILVYICSFITYIMIEKPFLHLRNKFVK